MGVDPSGVHRVALARAIQLVDAAAASRVAAGGCGARIMNATAAPARLSAISPTKGSE